MARTIAAILSDIEAFSPTDGDCLMLDDLSEELFSHASVHSGVARAVLGVFERFPTDDGEGVFWALLHGLESVDGYEEALVRSVTEKPSVFGLIMVNRLLNAVLALASWVMLRFFRCWKRQQPVKASMKTFDLKPSISSSINEADQTGEGNSAVEANQQVRSALGESVRGRHNKRMHRSGDQPRASGILVRSGRSFGVRHRCAAR